MALNEGVHDARPIAAPPAWRRWLGSRGLQAIVAIVAVAWAALSWVQWMGGVEGLRAHRGPGLAAGLVSLQAVVGMTPFPSEVIAGANSVIHGFWLGSVYNWVGWLMAAMLQYAIMRRTAQDFDFATALQRMPRWLRRFPVHHPVFLITARQLPLGPQIVNAAAGAYDIGFWRHTWCAAIGIIPGALIVSGVANGLMGS